MSMQPSGRPSSRRFRAAVRRHGVPVVTAAFAAALALTPASAGAATEAPTPEDSAPEQPVAGGDSGTVDGASPAGGRQPRRTGAQPGRFRGATVVKTGWWWVANEPPPETGVVAAQRPPSPTTPPDTLPVGAMGGDVERVSALELALRAPTGSTVRRLELALRESGKQGANAGAELATVVACPVTELFWADGQGAAWKHRPSWDCELGRAEGVRDARGVWRFDLTEIAARWTAEDFVGSRSVVLVEEVDPPKSFQIALDGPRLDGVGTLLRTSPPSDTADGTADGTTGTGTGAGDTGAGGSGGTSAGGTLTGGAGAGGGLAGGGLSGTGGGALPTSGGGADLAPVDAAGGELPAAGTDPTAAGTAAVPASGDAGAAQETRAAAVPVAGVPTWWSGLPWVTWLLVPFALALAYVVMVALGPDGRPVPHAVQRRGVGRALESVRRLGGVAAAATRAGAQR